MGIICGDFNLPNANYPNSFLGLPLSGIINDKVKTLSDRYRFLNFSQNNSYHPPLSITYSMPEMPPQLNDQHSFCNFNCFGTINYRYKFSLLRAQFKTESKLAYKSYLSIPSIMHYGDIITSDVGIINLFARLFKSKKIYYPLEQLRVVDLMEYQLNFYLLKSLLLFLFHLSLIKGLFPLVWKTSQVAPIYKSEDPGSVINYRLVSGLPLIGKLFEKIVYKCIELLLTNQHRFFSGRSTTTSALEFSSFIRDSFKIMIRFDVIQILFADDMQFFNCVQSENDAILLQKQLNKLLHWCSTVGLKLAIHKCKYDYFIDNVMLKRINQVEDLGKALRSLGFIRRHAESVMSVKMSIIITSLVRSIVEYSSVLSSLRTK
ncbi:hypothetical protein AGLY_006337 [Aphis glycines]|uniref:Reverse transcriptase domain-containing protein n=1 Tax=Aphis glycines TaxID=307491 RepID=A0A6G0TQV5_APHGL|nr:hypothetical protein AGLY_006337 [Aphis glycines]